MTTVDTPQHAALPVRIATRIVFFIAGFGMSAWAPLVPFAKLRLDIGDASLGLLLLCLGIGSLMAMPLAAPLAARLGCKRLIIGAGVLLCLALPALALTHTLVSLGLSLLLFGIGLGAMDISMNIQAVAVEKASGRAMMSGFHGFFSIGGIAGAGLVSILLWLGCTPFWSIAVADLLIVALMLYAGRDLLSQRQENDPGPLFARPRGKVMFIGLLCFILFLTEGAMLDWSALFLTVERGLDSAKGGLGYALFSIAMTIGRLNGDRLINAIGRYHTLAAGSLCASAGIGLAIFIDQPAVTLLGFMLVGLGASNLVPLLFSVVGRQTDMPPNLALAAISGVGYAGILAGPALIGFIAHLTSLFAAFGCVALLLLVVTLSARRVTR
ncbi:MFS transporter [Acerihabitans arboris]|uniref:MFS transporter n=1 Tax=Acerihabitans arboris TaxID=2691583 RepID=A0A845SQ51_9GAMM|nr:MFS transporter [Acerihabitans arboris]NDL65257.1 MFS transporter [Acerihabitans arboris]